MRPTLLQTLFPRVRAEVLRLLFTNQAAELYVRELAREASLALHTVQDELARLSAAGIVVSRSNGYHRFYKANPTHALYPTLRRLVVKSSRLQAVPRAKRKIRRRPETHRSRIEHRRRTRRNTFGLLPLSP